MTVFPPNQQEWEEFKKTSPFDPTILSFENPIISKNILLQ